LKPDPLEFHASVRQAGLFGPSKLIHSGQAAMLLETLYSVRGTTGRLSIITPSISPHSGILGADDVLDPIETVSIRCWRPHLGDAGRQNTATADQSGGQPSTPIARLPSAA
jgi:hypothetical protein